MHEGAHDARGPDKPRHTLKLLSLPDWLAALSPKDQLEIIAKMVIEAATGTHL